MEGVAMVAPSTYPDGADGSYARLIRRGGRWGPT